MTAKPRVVVTVVGAGSWGTALANLLAQAGHTVRLWAREAEVVEDIRLRRANSMFLEGISLDPHRLESTTRLDQAFEGTQALVWVCPAQYSRALLEEARPYIPDGMLIVSGTKGIEVTTLCRMDELFEETLSPEQGSRFCVLSGPSFALEVAQGSPTAVVVAGASEQDRQEAQDLFQTDRFRVYTNPDIVGVELGGALKNVIALAAGAVSGLGLGHNAIAGLITRGLAEMTRLGTALGAKASTFAGLAGMGDLVLTCTGALSRNRTVGVRLGQGESIEQILQGSTSVAEGVATAQAVKQIADTSNVEMPISTEVYRILVEGADPRDAVHRLMTRAPKSEVWA